jgi:tetratricopeptide (TPR) repeat protein
MKFVFLIIFLSLAVTPVWAQTEEELLEKLETSDQTEHAGILNELARITMRRNPGNANEYAQKAGLLATELNQTNEIALSLKYRGIVAYFNSDMDTAMDFFKESLTFFIESGNDLETGNIYNNIANIYNDTRRYDKALEYYLKSLEIRERLSNTRLIIASYINIGNLFINRGEFVKADSIYSNGLDLNRLIFPDKIDPLLLKRLGDLSILLGNHQRAANYLEEALKMAENEQNNIYLFTINNTLGNYYVRLGNFELALIHYEQALEVANILNLKLQTATILLNIEKLLTLQSSRSVL